MSELIRCARALVHGRAVEDFAFVVTDGVIIDAGAFADLRVRHADVAVRSFPSDRLVVPGFMNGHSHAYQILLRGWADDWPFAKWRSEALYRVVPRLTPEDVYWVFTAAFCEMLAAGITSVAEFFYLNGAGNAHAVAAISAAADAGIRLVFARTWMDAGEAPAAFREETSQAAERTAELMEGYPDAHICVAPHSLHAASPQMIRAAGAFAREHHCLLHMHVAEAAYEGEETLARYGATPIRLLEQLGVLDERLVAIHAIYLDEQEKRLLGACGARVIHNPMTNQYLGDGTCDVVGLLAQGVRIGLGTDANVKPSLLDEMRAAALLQKLAHCDGTALDAAAAFSFGTAMGADALGLAAGELAAGAAADFVVLDAAFIDPWTPPINALVYRAQDAHVLGTFVAGRRVYAGGPSPLAAAARHRCAEVARRLLP
ncbi:MAG: amidohydrolase family protein [Vulcanimicrobiaceae bacterium]